VHAAELQHKNPVTAYEGRELRGVVRRTILAGRTVDIAEGSPPAGRLVAAR
jgi:allantoinase